MTGWRLAWAAPRAATVLVAALAVVVPAFAFPGGSSELTQLGPDMMPTVNVRDHGAVGDGRSDETRAIRTAMAALPGAGGVLFFPPGRYLTDTIRARSFTTYLGHSAWAYSDPLPGAAVISPVRPDQLCLFDASGTHGTRFVGLVLRGLPEVKQRAPAVEAWSEADERPDMDGIYLMRGGDQCVVDDCRLDLFSGSGVKAVNPQR